MLRKIIVDTYLNQCWPRSQTQERCGFIYYKDLNHADLQQILSQQHSHPSRVFIIFLFTEWQISWCKTVFPCSCSRSFTSTVLCLCCIWVCHVVCVFSPCQHLTCLRILMPSRSTRSVEIILEWNGSECWGRCENFIWNPAHPPQILARIVFGNQTFLL